MRGRGLLLRRKRASTRERRRAATPVLWAASQVEIAALFEEEVSHSGFEIPVDHRECGEVERGVRKQSREGTLRTKSARLSTYDYIQRHVNIFLDTQSFCDNIPRVLPGL